MEIDVLLELLQSLKQALNILIFQDHQTQSYCYFYNVAYGNGLPHQARKKPKIIHEAVFGVDNSIAIKR